MLKAKLDSVRKNKKGFSLVELIIVIAIMVALIAVMAPAFVKYVQKSRNSALATAAESLYSAVQTYYSDPETDNAAAITFYIWAKGGDSIQIATDAVNGTTLVTPSSEGLAGDILTLAGVDTEKNMGAATISFKIEVKAGDTANDGFTFAMSSAEYTAPSGT